MQIMPNDLRDLPQSVLDKELFDAAQSGSLADLKELLNAGADPTCTFTVTGFKHNALTIAATNGHSEIIDQLLKIPSAVADIAAEDNLALRWAAKNGHTTVVERLLKYPAVVAQITVKNNVALRWAAKNGHIHVVNLLLENPDVVKTINAFDQSAFNLAIENKRFEVINRLLEYKAIKAIVNKETKALMTKKGFYKWQIQQRKALLSCIQGLDAQHISADIILMVLKHAYPCFSKTVHIKQCTFVRMHLQKNPTAQALVFSHMNNDNANLNLQTAESADINTKVANQVPQSNRPYR